MKTLRAMAEAASLLSLATAGLLGIAVSLTVGPYLAMGAQIYGGNTEPRTPDLPYPWLLTFALALVPLPLVLRKKLHVAVVAALPFAMVPWWQLWRLFEEAGRP